MVKPFYHLDPVVPELTWIQGTTGDPKGQETFWSMAEVSALLWERRLSPPDVGEGERQKQIMLGSAQGW